MHDVVIVGGGPAGLATAIAARRHGLATVVLEAREPPLDKACGEGLMPSALAALAALGVELGDTGRPFAGIRYAADGVVAEADFPDGAHGRGVRRVDLHRLLFAVAAAAGVEWRSGERVLGLTPRGVATAAGEIAARFTVGADGLQSKVRAWAGWERPAAGAPRFGVRRHVALAPASERVEVVFGAGAEAYLTPLADDALGVALLWRGPARGFDDLLATRFPPAFAERLRGAPAISRDRGAGPFRQRARRAAAGRVALVGDAGGYVDALTGEGLAIAFEEALALAPALACGDLAVYARASARLRRVPELVTRLALTLTRHPRARRRALAALAADPALFSRLLGVLGARRAVGTVGGAALARFGSRLLRPTAPRLGWAGR
ncbi:MAG: NAD(P)/FAD-dependent oxidoreductase [Thermoanaerobaculia bacterium]|nr:NAD(P)/FAD-dependent oxidoreductase [Thermoanaerobaculia bacterium]